MSRKFAVGGQIVWSSQNVFLYSYTFFLSFNILFLSFCILFKDIQSLTKSTKTHLVSGIKIYAGSSLNMAANFFLIKPVSIERLKKLVSLRICQWTSLLTTSGRNIYQQELQTLKLSTFIEHSSTWLREIFTNKCFRNQLDYCNPTASSHCFPTWGESGIRFMFLINPFMLRSRPTVIFTCRIIAGLLMGPDFNPLYAGIQNGMRT